MILIGKAYIDRKSINQDLPRLPRDEEQKRRGLSGCMTLGIHAQYADAKTFSCPITTNFPQVALPWAYCAAAHEAEHQVSLDHPLFSIPKTP